MLALVFGYRGRAEVDRSRGRIGGRGLAVAGIVLGWIGLAIAAFWIYFVLFATISITSGGRGPGVAGALDRIRTSGIGFE